MSTGPLTVPSLRGVLLDALNDAFWARRGEIEGCRDCTRNPAGICVDHQGDNDAAFEYEEARKLLERSPGHPDVLAAFAGLGGAT